MVDPWRCSRRDVNYAAALRAESRCQLVGGTLIELGKLHKNKKDPLTRVFFLAHYCKCTFNSPAAWRIAAFTSGTWLNGFNSP